MTTWRLLAGKALFLAVLVLPALLAFFSPDGAIWTGGGGKGGKP